MNKDMVLTGFCLDDKGYWNGHYIVTICDNKIALGVLAMRKRLTKKDKDFLSKLKEVYYV